MNFIFSVISFLILHMVFKSLRRILGSELYCVLKSDFFAFLPCLLICVLVTFLNRLIFYYIGI